MCTFDFSPYINEGKEKQKMTKCNNPECPNQDNCPCGEDCPCTKEHNCDSSKEVNDKTQKTINENLANQTGQN